MQALSSSRFVPMSPKPSRKPQRAKRAPLVVRAGLDPKQAIARQSLLRQEGSGYCFVMATANCLYNLRDQRGLDLPEAFHLPLMAAQIQYSNRGRNLEELVQHEVGFIDGARRELAKEPALAKNRDFPFRVRYFGEGGNAESALWALKHHGIVSHDEGPQLSLKDLVAYGDALSDLRLSYLAKNNSKSLPEMTHELTEFFTPIVTKVFGEQKEPYPGSKELLGGLTATTTSFQNNGPGRQAFFDALGEHPHGLYASLKHPRSTGAHAVCVFCPDGQPRKAWVKLDSFGNSGVIRDKETFLSMLASYTSISF